MNRPYELGWIAAETGRTMRDNPYLDGTGYAIAWRNGFRAFLESIGA